MMSDQSTITRTPPRMTRAAGGGARATFRPSAYQQRIFDWVRRGAGNAIVNAVAGGGKTSTLVEAAHRLGDSDGIFVAFNKHIADELNTRLAGTRMRARTIHSVGMAALAAHLGGKVSVKEGKYRAIVRQVCATRLEELVRAIADPDGVLAPREPADTATNGGQDLPPGIEDALVADARRRLYEATFVKDMHRVAAERAFLKLFDRARVTLTPMHDATALGAMADHYALDVDPLYLRIAPRFLLEIADAGRGQAQDRHEIDFTDMLWLPLCWEVPLPTYPFVFVDECQDLSRAQLELVLKLVDPEGGRMLFVGDPCQAIYSFAGADNASFARIGERTHATELPLSVCYRCPTSVVALARDLVPQIEARPHAPDGVVDDLLLDTFPDAVRPGDMVLCRLTAPLIAECIRLIGRRIPARVRGRDLGKQLTDLAQAVALMPSYGSWPDFGRALGDYEATQTRALSQRGEGQCEALIEALADRCAAVRVCYETFGAPSLLRLCDEIAALFDDGQPGVLLSTVHRAKGLENPRVFLLKPHKLPLVWAKQQPHDYEQELHLKYVAITRATEHLTFVHDDAEKQRESGRGTEVVA